MPILRIIFLVTWHSPCRGFYFWRTQYREESFSRMLDSLPIIIAFLIAIGIPPVRLSRKFIKIHWWDYALPAIGLPVWIFLTFAEVGKIASLSNMVIEIIIVLGVSVVIPWARYAILYYKKKCCGNLSNYVSNSVYRNAFGQDVHAYAA